MGATTRRLTAGHGIVVAAGAWSGQILRGATGDARWTDAFRPRRGHLLEVPRPRDMPRLQRGLMEGDYAKVPRILADLMMSRGTCLQGYCRRVLVALSSACSARLTTRAMCLRELY